MFENVVIIAVKNDMVEFKINFYYAAGALYEQILSLNRSRTSFQILIKLLYF